MATKYEFASLGVFLLGSLYAFIVNTDVFAIIALVAVILLCAFTATANLRPHSAVHNLFLEFLGLCKLLIGMMTLAALISYLGARAGHLPSELAIQMLMLSRFLFATAVGAGPYWLLRPDDRRALIAAGTVLAVCTLVAAVWWTNPGLAAAVSRNHFSGAGRVFGAGAVALVSLIGVAHAALCQTVTGRRPFLAAASAQGLNTAAVLCLAGAKDTGDWLLLAAFVAMICSHLLAHRRMVAPFLDAYHQWTVGQLRATEQERRELLHALLAAQERERQALARDLHDDVGQVLARIVSLTDQPQHAELQPLAASALQAVRRLIAGLRPAALDDIGLVAAMRSDLERFSHENGVLATFQAVGDEQLRFEPRVENDVYRAYREALSNVARHSRAAHLGVLVDLHPDSVRVVVEDDGIGFAPSAKSGCFGIKGMVERIAGLGGELTIETAPGRGTTVYINIPIGGVQSPHAATSPAR